MRLFCFVNSGGKYKHLDAPPIRNVLLAGPAPKKSWIPGKYYPLDSAALRGKSIIPELNLDPSSSSLKAQSSRGKYLVPGEVPVVGKHLKLLHCVMKRVLSTIKYTVGLQQSKHFQLR